MNWKRAILSGAGILCLVLALPFSALAANPVTITGAGSSFAAPVYQGWSVPVSQQMGLQVNYQSVGSSAGEDQVMAHTVDFGASDKPMAGTELTKARLYQFPTVMSGVVVVVNLPDVPAGRLHLDGPTLAGIYDGTITSWNDPKIRTLNPQITLPDTDIAPVHRADGSGTSYVFTSYLSHSSPEWREQIGAGTLVGWPGGAGAHGNDGVAALVRLTKGSIGYVEYAFAAQNHMSVVLLKNRDGAFVAPSLAGFAAAARAADWKNTDHYAVNLLDQHGAESWPIVTATYALVPEVDAASPESKAVQHFFAWGFAHGEAINTRLGYVGLPDSVKVDVMRNWPVSSGPSPARPLFPAGSSPARPSN